MKRENAVLLTHTLKNGQVLTLRNAVPSDAEQVVAYMQLVGGESDNLSFGAGELELTAAEEREFIETLHSDGRSVMLVGLIEGELAAMASLTCEERPRIRHDADLSISVREKYWNLGIGSAMLHALIDYAKRRGDIINIFLGVRVGNDNAIHLYEKHGFETIGCEKRALYFGGAYHDSNMMELCL